MTHVSFFLHKKNASKGKKNRFIPVFVACKAVLVKWSVM